MARSHLTAIVAELAIGAPEGYAPAVSDYAISEDLVLAIPGCYAMAAQDSYCPVSNIPDWVGGLGVHYNGSECYVAGDNGQCLFVFKLVKSA